MKTASAFLQLVALSACFAAQFHAPGEFRMPGVRKALQTISASQGQPSLPNLTIDAGV